MVHKVVKADFHLLHDVSFFADNNAVNLVLVAVAHCFNHIAPHVHTLIKNYFIKFHFLV